MDNRNSNKKNSKSNLFRNTNVDMLAWIEETNLINLMLQYEEERKYQNKEQHTKQIEVEICYLQRELDIRNSRKVAHANWLKSLGMDVSNVEIPN